MFKPHPNIKMKSDFLFAQFPDAMECFVAGSDAFLREEDASSHAEHFNLTVKKIRNYRLFVAKVKISYICNVNSPC
jgi:hypothetical protein